MKIWKLVSSKSYPYVYKSDNDLKNKSACFDLSLTCLSLVYDIGKLQSTCMIKQPAPS